AETIRGRPSGKPMRFTVGLTDAFPKLVAYRLLAPALRMEHPVHLVLHDDRPERLYAELSIQALDLVLTDTPLPPTAPIRAYNHLLGECGVSFFGTAALAEQFGGDFPRSLDGAPFLLPAEGTTLRRSLSQWFDSVGVRPHTVAEVGDSALLKTFGQAGTALFAGPTVIEAEIRRQYRVEAIARVETVRERFYAITVERRLKHPAVVAIAETARDDVFLTRPGRSRGRREPAEE
ncbi:MAG TPA: LysR substrate-binding domain-containing protein, partial [Longimicrobium sp.]|nr:LysR substrate-binding domain-containing protein [Longimicrobium sp.]